MAITNPDKVVTKQDLADFYGEIFPYLGGMPEMVANKFSKGDIYSTDEKMIGQWTNGKPLYMKTVSATLTATSAGGTKVQQYVAMGATIDEFVDVEVRVKNTNGTDMCLPLVDNSSTNDPFMFFMPFNNSASSNKNTVRIDNAWVTASGLTLYVTAKYTKTTDSATSIGVDTDYSTTEKIVGTWIDGKPLYQKTINCGTLPSSAGNMKSTAHGISNLDTVACINGVAKSSTGSIPLPFVSHDVTDSGKVNQIAVTLSSTSVNIITGKNRSDFTGYVTLQYTKTT